MADEKAQEVISLRDTERARQSQFRTLWQSVANLMFPQTFPIDTEFNPGSELMDHLYDITGVEEGENMANGVSNTLYPPGMKFFAVGTDADLAGNWEAKNYLSKLSKKANEEIANSKSFRLQTDSTIHYWAVFGMGALYTTWNPTDGLVYRDYAIGTYQCLENEAGLIDTIILTCPLTARQIVQRWGLEQTGESVRKAYEKPETRGNSFNVIHIVRPRSDFDNDETLRPATRMPWESLFVQEKDKIVLQDGGYDEFPFAIPRYKVIYREVYGRGRGVDLLPAVRQLNRRKKDFDEMSNKWVNPPKEVLDTFEGAVDVTPGALNYVTQIPTIKAMDMGANGMFPVTKDLLEYFREEIRDGFFRKAFEPLTSLTGDRRNTLEISQRLKEGMKRMGKPIARVITELLAPTIQRSVLLLIRNGVVPRPPEVLQGRPLKIKFIGPLAKALEDYEASAGEYWVGAMGQAASVFPDVLDNVDSDAWARDFGDSLGVNPDHIRPMHKVKQLRSDRAAQQQQMQQAEAAMAAAEGYGKVNKAPEQGSPAAQLMEAGR